ncbi:MAG: DUF3034 family protein [Pseudomonadota bacterium]|nr:DUF3034 family protein [Pseudomonadota bacterium]
MNRTRGWRGTAAFFLAAAIGLPAWAEMPAHGDGQGKLLLTGGTSSIDGVAGGGLTPWAVVGSYAADREIGATAFVTRLKTQDYGLTTWGAALGVYDRAEISLSQQRFDASAVGSSQPLRLDIVGLKLRVAGEAVLDADTWIPQIALGAEFKHLDPGPAVGSVLDAVGAHREGVDLYASATKLLLAQGLLLNGTLRATRANQNGLLGFGARGHDAYRLRPEMSLAWLLRKDFAAGVELRLKPDNLAFAGAAFREEAWKDLFLAWAPTKHFSLTLAYVDLGNLAGKPRQSGAYVSVQLAD